MQSDRFLAAYPTPKDVHAKDERLLSNSLSELSFEIDSELKLSIETSHAWSMTFTDFLHDRISERETYDEDEIVETLGQYYAWAVTSHNFFDTLYELRDSLPIDSNDRHIIGRELSHASFHRQNAHFTVMWAHFLLSDESPDSVAYRETSRQLAFQGVVDFKRREDLIRDDPGSYYSGQSESHQSFLEGNLGETDAALVLLDIAKKSRNRWLVLPAPAGIEYMVTDDNADFLVIDPTNQRSVGVQVKSRMRSDSNHNTKNDRIVFIDCNVDLGNHREVQYTEYTSGPNGDRHAHTIRKTVPHNGLYAVEILSSLKLTRDELLACRGLAHLAQTRKRGFKSHLRETADIIENRIKEKL